MEVTLNLPEQVYRNFSKLAEKKHRRVEEVIADWLQDDFFGREFGCSQKLLNKTA